MVFLKKFNRGILKISTFAVIFFMALMAVLVFSGVMARYVFHTSFSWANELARFLLIWISFLGAAIAISQGSHTGISFLENVLSPSSRKWLKLLNFLIVGGVILILGWFGWLQVIANKGQLSPTMRISMSYPYLAIPVGCFLMFLFGIERILKEFILDREDKLKGIIK